MALWLAEAVWLFLLTTHLASAAVAMSRCRRRRYLPPSPGAQGVSLLRPVCGLENFSEETLRSSFTLDYPDYEIIFCAASGKDPVVPLLRRLMAAHPQARAQLLIGDQRISHNPKLNNLFKGWQAAARDWVILADSNVLLPRDFIQQLLAAWRPDTGLVCSPPAGCRPQDFWAELECGFLNTYQARWQYFADSIGFGFAQGKSMLWHRSELERAGGLRALASEIAEDAAATKVVRENGKRVRLVGPPFDQPLGRRTAVEIWRRQLRWARLRRAAFPLYYVPEILSGGALPVLLTGTIAAANGLPVIGCLMLLAALWYGAEAALAYAAGWPLSFRAPFIWMLRDLSLPILWIAGWAGNEIVWHGQQMDVGESGLLETKAAVAAESGDGAF